MAQTTVEPGPAARARPASGIVGLVGAGAAVAALMAAGLTVLVNRLREGRFVIPDFQREFEWKPWDISELMRSIQ